jgi:hypothetical protein
MQLDVICLADSHQRKTSGRSHSHVGPPFHELEGFMDTMSRDFVYVHACCCDRAGQIGESGSLRREGWGEGRGYSEVPRC